MKGAGATKDEAERKEGEPAEEEKVYLCDITLSFYTSVCVTLRVPLYHMFSARFRFLQFYPMVIVYV